MNASSIMDSQILSHSLDQNSFAFGSFDSLEIFINTLRMYEGSVTSRPSLPFSLDMDSSYCRGTFNQNEFAFSNGSK